MDAALWGGVNAARICVDARWRDVHTGQGVEFRAKGCECRAERCGGNCRQKEYVI